MATSASTTTSTGQRVERDCEPKADSHKHEQLQQRPKSGRPRWRLERCGSA